MPATCDKPSALTEMSYASVVRRLIRQSKIFSTAVGKAAASMAYALEQINRESFAAGFMSAAGASPGFETTVDAEAL